MPPPTADFPPLLPLGFHPKTVTELRQMCVDGFPLSTTRAGIMAGFESVVDRLVKSWVVGDLWVDGSFLTEKIDPKDVDVVLRIGAGLYNTGLPEQRDAVNWIIANQKATLKRDTYALMEYPPDDPLYTEGEWWRAYWHVKWGFSRDEDPKGIAVISLPGGAK